MTQTICRGYNGFVPFNILAHTNFRSDPNGVLAFIVSQLQVAEDEGQRAWIYGHIPPGKTDFLRDQVRFSIFIKGCILFNLPQSNYFNQVVQRYKNTIAAQFYGHSHKVMLSLDLIRPILTVCVIIKDQLEIAYSDFNNQSAATADSFGLVCPSLTPTSESHFVANDENII